MPIEIKVTPPGLTMSQGRTFMVTAASGEFNPHSSQGVYLMDTRFVSSYHLYVNRQPWKLVNSSQITFFSSRIYLTNTDIVWGMSEAIDTKLRSKARI